MSDNQSEVNPASPEGESLNGSFSSNGNGPGAVATDAGQDLSFLDDLAKAMRTTAAAEQARDSEITDQRRQSHLDAIRAREALEAEELRELAKEDVKGIDAWSDGEIKRIKLERERRIASRREQLQVRLEEHRLVIASEVEAVENAISGYRLETERFFDRLGSQTDPVEIARQAGTRPPFPDLDQIGPQQEAAPVAAYQAPAYEPPAYTPPAYTMSVTSIPAAPATPAATEAVSDAADAPAEAPAESEAETVKPEATEKTEASAVAEPVGDPELAALVQASEPSAETVVAETSGHAEPAPIDPNVLIGVMDPAGGHDDHSGNGSPWGGGTDAVGEQVPAGDPVVAAENSGTSDGSDEPVSVGAEARVVMPRTTGGAGSWLRWPNSSIDRSDPSR